MPKKKTLQVPMDLAQLLVAEPDDFKDETKFNEVQSIAKALLRLLMEANK